MCKEILDKGNRETKENNIKECRGKENKTVKLMKTALDQLTDTNNLCSRK